MTKGGGKRHLKRLVVPKHFPVSKKAEKFVVRPAPGPHSSDECIPLAIIIRELLGYARTMAEVKKILHERNATVDGRVRNNRKYPVGFMDIIGFPKINTYYRMIYTKLGLRIIPIEEEEATTKLCQITNKTTLKGGLMQLNLHDGRNIVVESDESKNNNYKTHDTLKITIPEQEIQEKYEPVVGNYGIITSGRWMGTHGTIEEIGEHGTMKTKNATIRTPSGQVIQTLYRYIFVIGNDSPTVSVVEEKSEDQ